MMKRFCLIFVVIFSLIACTSHAEDLGFVKLEFESIPPRSSNPVFLSIVVTNNGLLTRTSTNEPKLSVTISESELKSLADKVKVIDPKAFDKNYGQNLASFDAGSTESLRVDEKNICCQVAKYPRGASSVVEYLKELVKKYQPEKAN